jgi:hypothetical protein
MPENIYDEPQHHAAISACGTIKVEAITSATVVAIEDVKTG